VCILREEGCVHHESLAAYIADLVISAFMGQPMHSEGKGINKHLPTYIADQVLSACMEHQLVGAESRGISESFVALIAWIVPWF
jgi:hypothetical protein